jgi:hypothetical protein
MNGNKREAVKLERFFNFDQVPRHTRELIPYFENIINTSETWWDALHRVQGAYLHQTEVQLFFYMVGVISQARIDEQFILRARVQLNLAKQALKHSQERYHEILETIAQSEEKVEKVRKDLERMSKEVGNQ